MQTSRYVSTALMVATCLLLAGTFAAGHIAGQYRHSGAITAMLLLVEDGLGYIVRLEGGVPSGDGATTPADCVINAYGFLRGAVLHARFAPVETKTFSYSAAQAEREERLIEIVFKADGAEVVKADTFGYCGIGADFLGPYWKVEQPPN